MESLDFPSDKVNLYLRLFLQATLSVNNYTLMEKESMCQPTNEEPPQNENAPESSLNPEEPKKSILKKDEHGYVVNDDDKDKRLAEAQAMADTWCCGLLGKEPIKSGRELGVWETSLEDQSDWISWILLSYLNPMLKLGSSKVLDVDDIGVPSEQDKSRDAYERVKVAWEQQIRKTQAATAYRLAAQERQLSKCRTEDQKLKLAEKYKQQPPLDPSLGLALFQAFGIWKLVVGMLVYLISQLMTFVPVLILEDLVRYFQSTDNTPHTPYVDPWVEVFGLLLVPFFVSILQTRYQVLVAHAGVFVRAAISLLLYHKSLKVSAAGRAKTSTGQVGTLWYDSACVVLYFLPPSAWANQSVVYSLLL